MSDAIPPLTTRQIGELKSLSKNPPLWRGVPPLKADPDLRYYIDNHLVGWTVDGYRMTRHGISVLNHNLRARS